MPSSGFIMLIKKSSLLYDNFYFIIIIRKLFATGLCFLFLQVVQNYVGHITIKMFVFITSKAILFLCKNKSHAW